jgi:hypothetical protein
MPVDAVRNKQLLIAISEYINENYVQNLDYPKAARLESECNVCLPATANEELAARLRYVDESFSEMLLRKIDEKGITDAQCYKKANIDRKLFSKIRANKSYRPSKTTAIAFAVALELSLEEAEDLLCKAGFALSHSSKFDIIIEYCMDHGIYDMMQINEILYAFDQTLLGV